ncbi:uncharacterized protein LOC135846991 [Planococcus citri]|uniref:uncharacterized protein LOC135846991 n=1 Tax=Planococcus citri TaxID=170843 RepID=UPI0031F92ACE
MEQYLVNAISNFVSTRTDIFGNESKYEKFKEIDANQTIPDGYNSTLFFGQILYKDRSGTIHESKPVVIKATPKVKNTRFISNLFINEINFYTKVIPTFSTLNESFPSLFPQFHYGETIFNPSGDQSVIILEDLKSRGYRMAPKRSFLDSHHLILMMRKLGEFHAYSYKAKNDIPNLFYPLANHCLETNTYVNHEHSDLLPSIDHLGFDCLLKKHPQYEQYSPIIEKMLRNATDIYIQALSNDNLKNPTSVICHSDFLRNNVMFKYENHVPKDMVLIDLANYRYGSPAIDLITVLYLNTDQRTRDELWGTLIDEYYTALKTTFANNRVPDKSEILSEFNQRAFYGYLVATYFLPSLIAQDNDIPLSDYDRVMGQEYPDMGLYQIPAEILGEMILAASCDAGIEALSDILRDMIDRGFICK